MWLCRGKNKSNTVYTEEIPKSSRIGGTSTTGREAKAGLNRGGWVISTFKVVEIETIFVSTEAGC